MQPSLAPGGLWKCQVPKFQSLAFEVWILRLGLLYRIVCYCELSSHTFHEFDVALLNMQAGCSHGKSENWQWPPLPTLSQFSLLGKIGFGLYWFFSTTAYPRTHRLCSLHCLAADFNILPTQNIWLNLWLSSPLWPALQIWKLIVSQLTEVVVQKCTCKSKSHSISQCTHLSRNKKIRKGCNEGDLFPSLVARDLLSGLDPKLSICMYLGCPCFLCQSPDQETSRNHIHIASSWHQDALSYWMSLTSLTICIIRPSETFYASSRPTNGPCLKA